MTNIACTTSTQNQRAADLAIGAPRFSVGADPTEQRRASALSPRIVGRLASRIVAASVLAVSLHSTAEPYELDTYHPSVHFAVSHNDISYVRGRFAKLRGSVQYDAQAKTGSMVISVQTSSIDTGNTA